MDFGQDNSELSSFITTLSTHILLGKDKLENHTKSLRKVCDLEGFDYQSLYDDLSDFFELLEEYRTNKSDVLKKALQLLGKRCFISHPIINVIIQIVKEGMILHKQTDVNGIYEGFILNNTPEGLAIFTQPDGTHYEGIFENGLMNGYGNIKYNYGFKYSGNFVDGKPQGDGVLTYPNKDKYVGQVVNGIPNGIGQLTYFSTGMVIEGSFINGNISLVNKIYTGFGTIEGVFSWVNGSPLGSGITKDKNGNVIYKGDISRFF